VPVTPLDLLWLEITGLCQLRCDHCYADSGPHGTHGTLSAADWTHILDQGRDLDVSLVQFIGGEPTLHPGLPRLMDHALNLGLKVEVYTNLVRVTEELWRVFGRDGVRLATSYYSSDAAEHDAFTGQRSHARTLANIERALRLGIPLRAGIIVRDAGADTGAAAKAQLEALGVTSVGIDRIRGVGRGRGEAVPGVDELCGACAAGKLAISATGAVWPCVFSRWLPVGDIRGDSLAAINRAADAVRGELATAFAQRRPVRTLKCPPDGDGDPCRPPCDPHYQCPPFKPL
jgi:sulfatase maturation enzyme AslB (radical SAM superfamily)